MRNTSFAQKSATLAAAVTLLTGFAVTAAVAQTPAPTPAPAPAPAPAATPPPNYKIQYNGLIDGYFLYDFADSSSKGLPNGSYLPGDNSYAIRADTPTLALAELNVLKNAKPNNLGFKTTLQVGDTTAVDHLALSSVGAPTPNRESRYDAIQQLYGTYTIGGNGAGIDFGKFYTPFGYEVVEANGNNNYTRSLPFFFLPVYHTGLRAYTPNMKGLTLTGIVANSLYNTATSGVSDDTNSDKAFVGSLNYTDPKGKYVFITTDGYSKDKYNVNADSVDDSGESKIFLSDNDLTYNATSTVSFGGNFEYGQFDQSHNNNKEYGYAGYAKDQFTPKQAISARFSAEDVKYDGDTGLKEAKPNEVTVTYEYKPAGNFTTRLEYRHDSVNGGNGAGIAFADSNGNINKSSQDMVIIAGLFTF